MSFTISHAAAALPFYRRKICFPAILIGCMVPDFEYFIWLDYIRRGAHSFWGLFYFCVPVGLVLLYLYFNFWRHVLVDLYPNFFRDRLLSSNEIKYPLLPVKRLCIIILSLIAGAAMHDTWDMFSHNFGPGPKIFPWLLQNVPYLHIQWWRVIYNIGSVIGIFMLINSFFIRAAKEKPIEVRPPRILPDLSVVILLFIVGIAFSLAFAMRPVMMNDYRTARVAAFFVLGAIDYFIVILTMVGIWRRIRTSATLQPDFN